jgi:hypothetical protein
MLFFPSSFRTPTPEHTTDPRGAAGFITVAPEAQKAEKKHKYSPRLYCQVTGLGHIKSLNRRLQARATIPYHSVHTVLYAAGFEGRLPHFWSGSIDIIASTLMISKREFRAEYQEHFLIRVFGLIAHSVRQVSMVAVHVFGVQFQNRVNIFPAASTNYSRGQL